MSNPINKEEIIIVKIFTKDQIEDRKQGQWSNLARQMSTEDCWICLSKDEQQDASIEYCLTPQCVFHYHSDCIVKMLKHYQEARPDDPRVACPGCELAYGAKDYIERDVPHTMVEIISDESEEEEKVPLCEFCKKEFPSDQKMQWCCANELCPALFHGGCAWKADNNQCPLCKTKII